MKRKLPAACVAVLAIALRSSDCRAEDGGVTDRSRELARVNGSIESVQTSIEQIGAKRNALLEQLSRLEREYGRLAQAIQESRDKVRDHQSRIDELVRSRRELREAVLTHNNALVGQVRAAYSQGRQEWLKLLLNQNDPALMSRMLTYYGYLNRARTAQLKNLRGDIEQALALERQLQAENAKLAAVQEKLAVEQDRIDSARSQRKEVLANLDRDVKDKNLRLKLLKQDSARLQALIASLQAPIDETTSAEAPSRSDASGDSRSGLPVNGELMATFGAPRLSGRWDGVLIAAAEGEPVRAVSAGRVAFADWLRGYGLMAIVDHGNGYMSLYAYNQSLRRNVGDWVEAGDVIASVGASGGQREPALYFGVRERGRPIDPLAWQARRN